MENSAGDLQVVLENEATKAIIKGKTNVPFQRFVGLVLQKKVFPLFKRWGGEPVIIDSELLTELASAKTDSQENTTHMVIVTLGVGVLLGIFVSASGEFILAFFGMHLKQVHYAFIMAGFAGLVFLFTVLSRIQKSGQAEKVVESLEKVANFLSKK